jgi:Flp pilus assembly protein TadB
MVELSYFALFLLFIACLAAGVVAGVVHTWSLRARTYSLEDRVDRIEGNLSREVKARAGQERWKKPDKDTELFKAMAAQPSPNRTLNWWERTGVSR